MSNTAGIVRWDIESFYLVCGYLTHLHAEMERTIETAVSDLLDHAVVSTQKYRPHPSLINVVTYFRGEVATRLPDLLEFIPPKSTFKADGENLVSTWDSSGAKTWFSTRLRRNHGAGMTYLGNMLHPVGIEVTEKEFKGAVGRGVEKLGAVAPTDSLELGKLVELRGAIVHSGIAGAKQKIGVYSRDDIAENALHAVEALAEACMALQRCW